MEQEIDFALVGNAAGSGPIELESLNIGSGSNRITYNGENARNIIEGNGIQFIKDSVNANTISVCINTNILDIKADLTSFNAEVARSTAADSEHSNKINSLSTYASSLSTYSQIKMQLSNDNYCTQAQTSAIVSAMLSVTIDNALNALYGNVLQEQY